MATMKLHEALPNLLTRTPEGSIRIAGTRITLESVVRAFRDGATPEEICQDFPALALAQVYGIVAFYLTHTDEVEAYLQEEGQAAAIFYTDLRARHASFLAELRQKLSARRPSTTSHA